MMNLKSILSTLALLGLLSACGGSDDSSVNGSNMMIVPGQGDTTYLVRFETTWSALTHPGYYPGGAHFSPVFIATHNASASFWMEGELATVGIKQMAEVGNNANLEAEAETIVMQANAETYQSGGGLNNLPAVLEITLPVKSDFPLVTLVTMLAPSTDWFTGVTSLDLNPNGVWLDNLSVDLYTYDAGTAGSSQVVPIFKITTSEFSDVNGVIPVGRLIFTKL